MKPKNYEYQDCGRPNHHHADCDTSRMPAFIADDCHDQLPIFSRVGRGLHGDSCRIEYRDDETGAWLDIYTIPGDGSGELVESFPVEGGALHYSYHVDPDTGTFTITFAYSHPCPSKNWVWTTPSIPFVVNADIPDFVGSDVKAVYTFEYPSGSTTREDEHGNPLPDEPWDQINYPSGTSASDWNTPANGDDWSVGLSYGNVEADIPCPTFAQVQAMLPGVELPLSVENGGSGVDGTTGDYAMTDENVLVYDEGGDDVPPHFKTISNEDLYNLISQYINFQETELIQETVDLSQAYQFIDRDGTHYDRFPANVGGAVTFSKYGNICSISVRLELVFTGPFTPTDYWANHKRYKILDGPNSYPKVGDVDFNVLNPTGEAEHIMAPMHCRRQNSATPGDITPGDSLVLDANWWPDFAGNSLWIGNDSDKDIGGTSGDPTGFYRVASDGYPIYYIEGVITYPCDDVVEAEERYAKFQKSVAEIKTRMAKESK